MAEQVADARERLIEACDLNDDVDHVVVASSPRNACATAFEWKGSRRLLLRAGFDDPALALLGVMETENIGRRFTDVLLASGDGIFAPVVSALVARGLRVIVAAPPDVLSHRLARAASQVIWLDSTTDVYLEAA